MIPKIIEQIKLLMCGVCIGGVLCVLCVVYMWCCVVWVWMVCGVLLCVGGVVGVGVVVLGVSNRKSRHRGTKPRGR